MVATTIVRPVMKAVAFADPTSSLYGTRLVSNNSDILDNVNDAGPLENLEVRLLLLCVPGRDDVLQARNGLDHRLRQFVVAPD